jgi:trk system potassium uptake protein
MFVLIVGGGRTGTKLAQMLLAQKHEISVIENRPDVLMRLHREIPTEVIFQGSAIDHFILENAGIRKAHVLAACSSSDADNLIVCFLARNNYQVPRTIARVNDPRNAWLFDQKFYVDVALNHSEVMAGLIEEEMSLGDMMTLLKLRRGEYSLVEEKIAEGATVIGKAIKDLSLPENCVIAGIIRRGKVVIPKGNTIFEINDEVLAITDRAGAEQLSNLLTPGWE